MKCDISIEEKGGVYRLRAHSALGHAFLFSLPASAAPSCVLAGELVVDELPRDLPKVLTAWQTVIGGKR